MAATWSPASHTARSGDFPPEVTRPCAVWLREGSAAIWAVASRIFLPSPGARSARRLKVACTAAAAAGMRAGSVAGAAPPGLGPPAGGSSTGRAMEESVPMTRPGMTASPAFRDIHASSLDRIQGGGATESAAPVCRPSHHDMLILRGDGPVTCPAPADSERESGRERVGGIEHLLGGGDDPGAAGDGGHDRLVL